MFLIAFFGGLLLGLLWDIYRLIRHYFKIGKLGLVIGDIMYWIASLYLGLNLVIYISWGNIRFFILIGFCLGALIYFWLISDIILKSLITIINFIISSIKTIFHIIIFPLKIVIKRLKFFLVPYKIKVDTIIKNRKKRIKFKLENIKKSREAKNKKKLKLKKIKRLMKEQRKNAKRFKNSKISTNKKSKSSKNKYKKEKKKN
ncbi:spore cortex biosynthesis protein YabQ [Sedimentibacter sp. zth1]|uniref:spore cortex biosynthesis protein YabQ n=1 Tax=Sedimentibacter sp. zth1 TaxID=2816908 RepID=UPI0035303D6E